MYGSTLCDKNFLGICRGSGRGPTLPLDHLCVAIERNTPGSAPLYHLQPGTYGRIVLRSQRSGSGRSKSALQRATACHSCAGLACLHTDLHRKHGNIATAMPQERREWGNTRCSALYQVCWPSRYVLLLVGFRSTMVCPILVVITLRVHSGRPSRGPLGATENHMKLSLSLHYISTPQSHEIEALGGTCCQTERDWSGESIRLGRLDACAWYLQLTLSDRAPHHQTDIKAAI